MLISDLPQELIALIIEKCYYQVRSLPDYVSLAACSLVAPPWRQPAQLLLFRRIDDRVKPVNLRTFFTTHIIHSIPNRSKALLANVRILSFTLGTGLESNVRVFNPHELSLFLEHCPALYELNVNRFEIFSLDESDLEEIRRTIISHRIRIRSLDIQSYSSQSPIIYQLISLFSHTLRFLYLGSEIASPPPSSDPLSDLHLYELRLSRIPPDDTLLWLLSSSTTSLRILDLCDLPSRHLSILLASHLAHLESLRLLRYNRACQPFLDGCISLRELVIFDGLAGLVTLSNIAKKKRTRTGRKLTMAFPATLEHLFLVNYTFVTGASAQWDAVAAAIEEGLMPRLKVVSCDEETFGSEEFAVVRRTCEAKEVEICVMKFKLWPNDDPVEANLFPRRNSVSNFALMN